MTTLAIIPARGGSKGIPKKNLKKINGISLVNLSVMMAKRFVPSLDILVSTDSKEIVHEVQKEGIEVPIMRPQKLSGDRVSDFEVIHHGLTSMEKLHHKSYDYIIMLQPTSPLRTSEDIRECIESLKNNKFDACWTVSEVDLKYHPLKQLEFTSEGNASLVNNQGKNIIARQQLNKTYIRNGACYAFTRDCIIKQRTIYGERLHLVVSQSAQVSIDTLQDLERAEKALLKRSTQ